MITREATMRDMRFTVCDVSRILGSVLQMRRIVHRVVFTPPWGSEESCTQHVDTGEAMRFEEQHGLYVFSTKVAPAERQSRAEQNTQWNESFGWPAAP